MAKPCRIEVNRAKIIHDRDGVPGLLIHRFDRVDRGKRKLHQDGCQLLDSPPANKYRLSLSNCDLHAKNISVLWDTVVRLTPPYDLLSTLPYKSLETRIALKIQGKDDDLRLSDFIDFGKMYGISDKKCSTTFAIRRHLGLDAA